MDSEAFVAAVEQHCGSSISGVQRVAPGLVIVKCGDNFAIYFDVDRWAFEHPDDWRDCETYPLRLHGSKLRVIDTTGHCGRHGYLASLAFARGVLIAIRGDEYYRWPRQVQ